MKNKLHLKYKKKKKHHIFSFLIVVFFLYLIMQLLNASKIKIKSIVPTNYLLNKSFVEKEDSYIKELLKKVYANPTVLLKNKVENPESTQIPTIKKEDKKDSPLIYIYNTHQTEEYSKNHYLEYPITPSVMIGNYILEDVFTKNGYSTLVETRNIKEVLNQNNWSYSSSYKASRLFLEDAKRTNPTLKYYIDVHRDSLSKDKTTIEIAGKSYAKLLFLIGMENETYASNLEMTSKIHARLNAKYPNLSKGIYKKSGPGVNGIYNQDFSPYVILIEVGGYENTVTEVLNSTLAFAEAYMEVLKEYENN